MYVTTSMHEAAFCKVNGFPIGKIYNDSGIGKVEINGKPELIEKCIAQFYAGYGVRNAQYLLKELGFIRHLILEATK